MPGGEAKEKRGLMGTPDNYMKATQILYVCSHGKVEKLAELIAEDPAVVNCKDYDDRTPLHLAASEGREDMLKLLLHAGADVNARDRWNGTALQDAVRGKKPRLVDALVKAGGKLYASGSLVSLEEHDSMNQVDFNQWEISITELQSDAAGGKEIVGHGSYGSVHRMKWRGTTVAVKKLNPNLLKDESALALFRLELNIMATLAHPNIVQFLGACTTVRPFYIITEYLTGGNLGEALKRLRSAGQVLKLDKAFKYALGTARGMAYLHGRHPQAIVHRDLKPENLLLDEYSDLIKITDFGLSRMVTHLGNEQHFFNKNYQMTGGTGSYMYMAPEVFRGEKYSFKVDVYSFGVILFEMFEGEKPFVTEPDLEKVALHAALGRRPAIRRAPPLVRALIEQCWNQDPELRPTFEEIVGTLERSSERTLSTGPKGTAPATTPGVGGMGESVAPPPPAAGCCVVA